MPAPAKGSLLASLSGQPRVRDFLSRAVETGRAAHAYLFVGAPGAGKLDAAWALAQALLCEEGGCGACDSCRRVAHRTHPDVHALAPESATGYLVSQIRELIEDVSLSPVRAQRKVYVIDRADLLRSASANALLKTLEEPPDNVCFVLLATSTDVMLPTIVSRCQCVPFRTVPLAEATRAVVACTGLDEDRCRMAVAVAGSPARACEFLKSSERMAARRSALTAVDGLAYDDAADVLQAAKGLVEAIKAPLAEVKSTQEAVLEHDADYLSHGALKQLEERHKRELTQRERSGAMEVLASVRSLLRDVLLVTTGASNEIINRDSADIVERLAARTDAAAAASALDAVRACEERISRNVTIQLALEAMLFETRRALYAPGNTR